MRFLYMIDNTELLNQARKACDNAYADYSKFYVGACALYDTGNYYTGANVENASYGLSLCAERNAMSNAVAAGEKGKLIKIAIFSKNRTNCMPCGACRQWMAEFAKDKDMQIILESEDSKCAIFTLEELLPYGFML